MVINLYRNGQLGNRLLHISAFIANSIEYNYSFYYLSFPVAYEAYFNIHDNPALRSIRARFRLAKHPLLNKYLLTVIRKLQHLAENKSRYPFLSYLTLNQNAPLYFDLNDNRYVRKARSKLLFVDGWRFNDVQSMDKHHHLIRELFKPKEQYRKIIDTIVEKAYNFGDILVGVHIRRGDYKDYQKGVWYYDDAVYVQAIYALHNFLTREDPNRSIVFLLCSDEVIDTNNYAGLPVIYIRKSEIIDMYALASCDYIIAPPSTFSGWASYYGNVPIYYINDPAAPFDENNFTTGFHQHFTDNAAHCMNYYDVVEE